MGWMLLFGMGMWMSVSISMGSNIGGSVNMSTLVADADAVDRRSVLVWG